MKMKVTLLLVCALLAAAQGRSLLASDGKPDSPPYEVKNSTRSLEIREYEEATWAVGFGRSRWFVDFAAQSAGLALASYFKGGNVAHTKIPFTVPLVATILAPPPPHHKNVSHPHGPPHKGNGSHHKPHHKHHGPAGPPAVALAAYLPDKFQGKAPIPDCPHVKLVNTNATTVYVHRFGGWALSFVVKHEIKHLALALKDIEICPRKGKFFVATYSGPWKIFGRHNEILWVKKPKGKKGEEGMDLTFNNSLMGLEALDVEKLFPEEFPSLDPPKLDGAASQEETYFSDAAKELSQNQQDLTLVYSDAVDEDGVQTS